MERTISKFELEIWFLIRNGASVSDDGRTVIGGKSRDSDKNEILIPVQFREKFKGVMNQSLWEYRVEQDRQRWAKHNNEKVPKVGD